ncbi:hypothetical protein REPUB_Repub05bG0126700 [Reevesia pubescens]
MGHPVLATIVLATMNEVLAMEMTMELLDMEVLVDMEKLVVVVVEVMKVELLDMEVEVEPVDIRVVDEMVAMEVVRVDLLNMEGEIGEKVELVAVMGMEEPLDMEVVVVVVVVAMVAAEVM